jgi:hypothetical protein
MSFFHLLLHDKIWEFSQCLMMKIGTAIFSGSVLQVFELFKIQPPATILVHTSKDGPLALFRDLVEQRIQLGHGDVPTGILVHQFKSSLACLRVQLEVALDVGGKVNAVS